MAKKLSVSVETPVFCNYDNIWKISWKIGGRRTNAFSTRGKRIGVHVSDAVKKAEYMEALTRGDIVAHYLTKRISRKEAIRRLKQLRFLCPNNPTAHLLTMVEFRAGLR